MTAMGVCVRPMTASVLQLFARPVSVRLSSKLSCVCLFCPPFDHYRSEEIPTTHLSAVVRPCLWPSTSSFWLTCGGGSGVGERGAIPFPARPAVVTGLAPHLVQIGDHHGPLPQPLGACCFHPVLHALGQLRVKVEAGLPFNLSHARHRETGYSDERQIGMKLTLILEWLTAR